MGALQVTVALALTRLLEAENTGSAGSPRTPTSQLLFHQPASDQHLELLPLSTFPELPSGYKQGSYLRTVGLQAPSFSACFNLKLNAPKSFCLSGWGWWMPPGLTFGSLLLVHLGLFPACPYSPFFPSSSECLLAPSHRLCIIH